MLAYYLDEPLTESEQKMVIEQINEISAHNITKLELIQFTEPIPSNDNNLTHAEIIKSFESILTKLNTPSDIQSIFILPKGGLSWGMLLQMAFKNVTQYYPFVVQPWEMNKDRIYQRRTHILVTDINSAMSGLNMPA